MWRDVEGGEWWVVSGEWWVVSGEWWVVSGEWWMVNGEWCYILSQQRYCPGTEVPPSFYTRGNHAVLSERSWYSSMNGTIGSILSITYNLPHNALYHWFCGEVLMKGCQPLQTVVSTHSCVSCVACFSWILTAAQQLANSGTSQPLLLLLLFPHATLHHYHHYYTT